MLLACCLLLTCCCLPAAAYLLLTCCLPAVACCLLLPTCCCLSAAAYLLLLTCCCLPAAAYLLLAAACCLLLLLPYAAAAAGTNILPKKKITISVALFGAGGRYGRETPAERGNVSGWLECADHLHHLVPSIYDIDAHRASYRFGCGKQGAPIPLYYPRL